MHEFRAVNRSHLQRLEELLNEVVLEFRLLVYNLIG